MNTRKKVLATIVTAATLIVLCLALFACDNGVLGGDETSDDARYTVVDGKQLYFTLELRNPSSETEISNGDSRPHAKTDGELIASWQIPCYGNTAYESIVKFFEDRQDKISFRLSQRRFYMFHEAVLENGDVFNLENAYISADGSYSKCANFQTLFGEDENPGTLDDLNVLVIVYQGWLY